MTYARWRLPGQRSDRICWRTASCAGIVSAIHRRNTDNANPSADNYVRLKRIVASALGASVGAIVSTYFGQNLVLFGLAIFLLGLVAFGFRVEKTGYRYASITFAIIVLIPCPEPPWIVAMHRFLEVAIGILRRFGRRGLVAGERRRSRKAPE
jgi:hypothetical protein